MPLYDCVMLLKPHVAKEAAIELMTKVGKHACRRNGVITDIKSFGQVQLGYGIKKLDGRYYQGQMMQMTMMTPPSFNSELHYLNKEDRLLRWLLVKHRDVKLELKFGLDFMNSEDTISELQKSRTSLYEDDDDVDEDDDDDEEEYELNQDEKKQD